MGAAGMLAVVVAVLALFASHAAAVPSKYDADLQCSMCKRVCEWVVSELHAQSTDETLLVGMDDRKIKYKYSHAHIEETLEKVCDHESHKEIKIRGRWVRANREWVPASLASKDDESGFDEALRKQFPHSCKVMLGEHDDSYVDFLFSRLRDTVGMAVSEENTAQALAEAMCGKRFAGACPPAETHLKKVRKAGEYAKANPKPKPKPKPKEETTKDNTNKNQKESAEKSKSTSKAKKQQAKKKKKKKPMFQKAEPFWFQNTWWFQHVSHIVTTYFAHPVANGWMSLMRWFRALRKQYGGTTVAIGLLVCVAIFLRVCIGLPPSRAERKREQAFRDARERQRLARVAAMNNGNGDGESKKSQ